MKKHFSTIILIIVFFIGFSVLLYPVVSNFLNQINASYAVMDYDEAVNNLSIQESERLINEAEEYNKLMSGESTCFGERSLNDDLYKGSLNVTGNGMMGYISINKIGVVLPIYHGTSEDFLSRGVGHLESSSLPVGGESTHSVIVGHRGLPSAKLFTDLDQLKKGDTFTITVLNRRLTYKVDQIKTVLPDEINDLNVIAGEDLVTLVTCTPYGVNTHRLLVRGVRVDNSEGLCLIADAMKIEPIIVASIMSALGLLILLAILLIASRRFCSNKQKREGRIF